MTENVRALLEQLKSKEYRSYRTKDVEEPIVYPLDCFGWNFGTNFDSVWGSGNVTANYPRIMKIGFYAVRDELVASLEKADTPEKKAFGEEMLAVLNSFIKTAEDFIDTARASGNEKLATAAERVPLYGATSFYEACLAIRSYMYLLRRASATHLGLGRFDQYMYEYYLSDKARGVTDEEIFETLEELFISLNHDTDRYCGWMMGDNGQSMVLGGYDKDGNFLYNELSRMCIDASLELELIDPKINLRVNKTTPIEIYEHATLLTQKALGFPQYCNDDVVVPGLIKRGYDPDDAYNYVVAACWEFIAPNCGADTPNKVTMNFPYVINFAIKNALKSCNSFEELMVAVKQHIFAESDRLRNSVWGDNEKGGAELSLFMDGCIESLTNMWTGGAKYNNFGSHGLGIASAADALAAVKKLVFEEGSLTPDELLTALEKDFDGYEDLRHRLLACPKMGCNDDYVDSLACEIMAYFGEALNNKPNGLGGIWRAGTGSAMTYLTEAQYCPATADGRHAGSNFGTNFSPALEARPEGILSVVQSFSKYDMTEIINGGPLTLEIHDTVLRNDIGIKKTAALVKAFIDLGGHQLQLNSINRERLLDAQKHPEDYPNLIVRVWGWSGYWNELDPKYQNHVISRLEFMQ